MRITILFGGTNKERLVSVATAQALHEALPDADLWFWDADNTVHEAKSDALLKHERPFEIPFAPGTPSIGAIEQALDKASAEDRLLVLGLHGGSAENGELQVMCEVARHSLHRLRIGVLASGLRQGVGQAVCRDRGHQGACRRRA